MIGPNDCYRLDHTTPDGLAIYAYKAPHQHNTSMWSFAAIDGCGRLLAKSAWLSDLTWRAIAA